MKSDFLLAITRLSAEKNLPSEVVLSAVESALVSAYRKDNFAPNQNITVKIDPSSGKVTVWAEKTIVEKPSDTRSEMTLTEARRIKKDAQLGEMVTVEATPQNAGRIAAQTAKQVILQRLHEAEHSAIFEEYAGREGEIVSGVVQRIDPKQVYVDLGRIEAVLPVNEQVHTERYRIGQRLKVSIVGVVKANKGPLVIVSRSHPDLLKRLFEMEVPEIFNGTVELKSIAREAGSRSKVAVAALQEGVDPVGCCVGLRGIRIQNIANELNGEKIDVIMWNGDVPVFIANALSPAQIISVGLNKKDGVATVVVPDRQLSLAIGREGQNVRLAAKLTGWRIDIKSASAAEAEKAAAAPPPAEEEEEKPVAEETPTKEPSFESVLTSVEAKAPAAVSGAQPEAAPVIPEPSTPAEEPALRFAEDIMAPRPAKIQIKSKKKKKKGGEREGDEEGIRGVRKGRRGQDLIDEGEEDY